MLDNKSNTIGFYSRKNEIIRSMMQYIFLNSIYLFYSFSIAYWFDICILLLNQYLLRKQYNNNNNGNLIINSQMQK